MKRWNYGVEYKLSLRIITRPFTWPRISSWFSGRLATSSDCVSAISPDMPPHQHIIIITIRKVIDHVGSKQRPLGAVHLGPFRLPNSHSPISMIFPDPAGPFPYLQIQFDFYNLKYRPSSFSNLPNYDQMSTHLLPSIFLLKSSEFTTKWQLISFLDALSNWSHVPFTF